MTWGAYGAQNPSQASIRQHSAPENDIRVICVTAGQGQESPLMRSAPSRIRTCAHGSGGRCSLP
jgi:hypothetical protein